MSEEMIVKHCSPTLAGMKTGNIFTCPYGDAAEMKNSVRRWNRLLGKKGLRVLPLKFQNGKALIYIFRPNRLYSDLRHDAACRILRELGYSIETPERCVLQLIKRLDECKEFPHEIGLFLGYPPEDVRGFIKNGASDFKCVGCWKVYGDVEAARKLFTKYKKCTDIYSMQFAKGKSVDRLTVTG